MLFGTNSNKWVRRHPRSHVAFFFQMRWKIEDAYLASGEEWCHIIRVTKCSRCSTNKHTHRQEGVKHSPWERGTEAGCCTGQRRAWGCCHLGMLQDGRGCVMLHTCATHIRVYILPNETMNTQRWQRLWRGRSNDLETFLNAALARGVYGRGVVPLPQICPSHKWGCGGPPPRTTTIKLTLWGAFEHKVGLFTTIF